ncbi:MAG: CDP-diacylglycerol--serine O-phosphatidyltransferase [Ezakiella sp.]|nr:CDP-diacylglycerol--serine O-phosphatidyltransferase [Ezakiella sp.]
MKISKDFFKENAANFITFCNMLCGALSILFTIDGKYRTAMAFIVFASIADRYDGRVARKFKQSSAMGVQMDSMGDIISFGIAPALLSYMIVFDKLEGTFKLLGAAATAIYIVAGALRLARFNVIGMDDDNCFHGLPIPVCGLLLVGFLFLKLKFSPIFYFVLMVLLGLLMLSNIRVKKR